MKIPDDIRAAARAVVERGYDEGLLAAVAAALLAERQRATAAENERCAKIAEEHGQIVSNDPVGKACSRNIAAAIRNNPRYWLKRQALEDGAAIRRQPDV